MQTEPNELRPFHETIVDALLRAETVAELNCLGLLIKTTKIPKDHDKIVAAWCKAAGNCSAFGNHLGVPANLLKQKETTTRSAE